MWGYPAIAFNTTQPNISAASSRRAVLRPPSDSGFYMGRIPRRSTIPSPARRPGYVPLPVNTLPTARLGNDPGCYQTISPAYNAYSYSNIADRENVINLHIGIPHQHDAGRDDVQLLYNVVALQTPVLQLAERPRTQRHHAAQPSGVRRERCPRSGPISYTWPSGTHFGQSASGSQADSVLRPRARRETAAPTSTRTASTAPPQSTASARPDTFSAVPPDTRDAFWNNASIFKLQYQHNIGSNAYFRIYGYTFYSDWLQTSALSYGTPFFGFGVSSYDYELESHTRGAVGDRSPTRSAPQHLLTLRCQLHHGVDQSLQQHQLQQLPRHAARRT